MKSRFIIKSNHPMFGKNHSKFTLSLISKPGILNLMYGKMQIKNTKNLITIKVYF